MKKIWLYLVLLFLLALLFSGCQYPSRLEVLGPKEREVAPPPLERQIIEKRTRYLEEMLLDDKLEPGQKPLIKDFIDIYSYLLDLHHLKDLSSNNRYIINMLSIKIKTLEEDYLEVKKTRAQRIPHRFDYYHKERTAIFESYRVKDYQGVIRQCLNLEESYGPQSLTPEIGLVFALSLAEKKMIGQAIKVGEKIIEPLAEQPDLLLLRIKLIEWYMAEGQKEKALVIHEELSQELAHINSLKDRSGDRLQKLQAQRPEKKMDTTPHKSQAEPWLKEIFQEADRLVQNQAYTEAKLLLIKARLKTDVHSQQQIIDQALKDIETTPKRIEQGEEPIQQVPEKQALQLAVALMEEEKYEEAIKTLEKIERQQSTPDIEARRLKNLAVENVINRDRNRAAQLYLQSRQVQDRSQKKKLLQSSLNILNNLVEQYPSSYLIERINEHISIVKKALADL